MQADQINENEMKLEFDARSVNEGFARMAVAAFVAELNPTLDEISDIKTAVSEAVTNAIIHGYDSPEEKVEVSCKLCGNHAEDHSERSWSRDCGCTKSHGTFFYDETGTGAFRHGICFYGSIYG